MLREKRDMYELCCQPAAVSGLKACEDATLTARAEQQVVQP